MISLNTTGWAHNECVPTVADLLSEENNKKIDFEKDSIAMEVLGKADEFVKLQGALMLWNCSGAYCIS